MAIREAGRTPALSPVTLKHYTYHGQTDLARGEDFIVRRTSPFRRQLMFTERGLKRLAFRQYRAFGDPHRAGYKLVWWRGRSVPPIKGSP